MICWTPKAQGRSRIVDKDSQPRKARSTPGRLAGALTWLATTIESLLHIATVPLLEAAREHRQCDK
jgi:hypothetical protein